MEFKFSREADLKAARIEVRELEFLRRVEQEKQVDSLKERGWVEVREWARAEDLEEQDRRVWVLFHPSLSEQVRRFVPVTPAGWYVTRHGQCEELSDFEAWTEGLDPALYLEIED